MTTSMRMEEDPCHMTEKILNLTLEIIYLLTGESLSPVKSGDHMTITVPSPHLLAPARHSMQKILDVTKKLIELLTGEIGDFGTSNKEELEYLEGHKDLYKDVMMENQPPLTSPDGSSNGNPLERCPRPLYSRDSTQEGHTIPHHHQSGNHWDYNIVLKEEYKEEDEEYGLMEEFSEGHKDMMDPPSSRNPPERCPRPLYSRDSTQEDHTIPQHHQNGNLKDFNIIIKEEFKEEDDEYGVMEFSDGDTDLYTDVMKEPTERCSRPLYSRDSTQEGHTISHHHQNGSLGDLNIVIKEEEEDEEYGVMEPTERCPRPLYSRDSTQEGHTIPHHHQGEDLIQIKVKDEVEETYVRDDQQYTEEAGMMRTFIEEDTPTEISTGHAMEKPSKDRLTLSPGCKMEDEDITGDCGGEKTMSSTMDGGLHSVDRPWNPSDSEQPRIVRDGVGIQGEEAFSSPECGESFTFEPSLSAHQRSLIGEKPHACPDCGKCFATRTLVVRHQRSHTGEKPYSCPQCGKSYSQSSQLLRHRRLHTGEKPYPCPECGKCFPVKYELVAHQRSHMGEKPFSCPECGKGYPRKLHLIRHQRSHTGQKPYSCPECRKCFKEKSHLLTHQRTHTGEKPYSCPECGKCFLEKYHLNTHLKTHTGEKPYSCPECGRCFLTTSLLNRHRRMHTGEKLYSCPKCGKGFTRKCHVSRHQRCHTTLEKP
ncbi:uncharacterized protein [Aquarana catesbeiana]|uniref:uncharacterized protein n=1 Tax=Aquarana catesbeiana TaxID=8400 RepID=UPI003CCA3F15